MNFGTPLLLLLLLAPLAMSLGMSYKPNLNAHIPGTPLTPGKSAAATGWQVWEACGGGPAVPPRQPAASPGLEFFCPVPLWRGSELSAPGSAPPLPGARPPRAAPRRPSAGAPGAAGPAPEPPPPPPGGREGGAPPAAGFPPCPAPRGG